MNELMVQFLIVTGLILALGVGIDAFADYRIHKLRGK